jgi:hypothetical protein
LFASAGARRKGNAFLLPVSGGDLDPTLGKGEIDEGTFLFQDARKRVPLRNLVVKTKLLAADRHGRHPRPGEQGPARLAQPDSPRRTPGRQLHLPDRPRRADRARWLSRHFEDGRIGIFDAGPGAIAADPRARTVSVSGIGLALQAQAAKSVNEAFAEGKELFRAGEAVGILSFTAQGQ